MKAFLCGLWDGANLWLQWDDVAPGTGYRLRVRAVGDAEWREIGGPGPLRKPWLVLPMWSLHGTEEQPGATVEAQVAVADDLAWVPCAEVTFARSRCRFEIRAGRRGVHYQPGTEFHCIVDGAAAHYRLQEEIELADGEAQETEVVATLLSGYCQLDRPDHFLVRPALGTVIRNVAPSVDDITGTGALSSALRVLPRIDQPLKIAFGRRLF